MFKKNTNPFIYLYRRQLLKLLKSEETNDSSSIKDTRDESIDFTKSVKLFSDTMDSELGTQIMRLKSTSNAGILSEVDYQNVELCDNNKNLNIENGPLNTNRIQESIPEGRHIIDISFLWNEIHRIFDNHARGIECQFKDWKLVNSRRRGLKTHLFFKC